MAPPGTPYAVRLALPNTDAYDPGCEPTAQPLAADIDATFVDAMRIRHSVFILEQKVPLESEFDDDDARSVHWVAYVGEGSPGQDDDNDKAVRPPPVGTIRAVPYPQAPHPTPGGDYAIIDGAFVLRGRRLRKAVPGGPPAGTPPAIDTPASELEFVAAESETQTDRATSLHDGREPYIKLGRIAVLASARGSRLGRFLVQTALDWIQTHPAFFDAHDSAAAAAVAAVGPFNGLVCLHAQVHALDFYKKLGFVIDEDMGTWWEEGIPHVGMFQRLDLAKRS